jgi:hypothetical protein
MRKIFAFGHQKRVGKDQFITFLIDILRPQMARTRIVRRGFADKLYDVCHSLYAWAGFRDRQFYVKNPGMKDQVLPDLGKTPREVLIQLSNKMREYDPNIWLNSTIKTDDSDVLLISDLRYPNEFDAITAAGGKCIKITRPGLVTPTDEADTALNACCAWDLVIQNNTDLGDLWKMAETFVKEFIN